VQITTKVTWSSRAGPSCRETIVFRCHRLAIIKSQSLNVSGHARPLVSYSPERKRQNQELRRYLYKNLYYNPRVHQPNLQAVRLLEELFAHFLKHPDEMGSQAKKRLKHDGLHRAVCDYLAGMTDRYAMLEYQRSLKP